MTDPQRQWLGILATMLTPLDPATTARALAPLLPLFGLPDGAFTLASAKAVCREERFGLVPSFEVIERALNRWWRDNRPTPVPAPVREALPAPAPVYDAAAVARLRRERAEAEAARKPQPHAPMRTIAQQLTELGFNPATLARQCGREA